MSVEHYALPLLMVNIDYDSQEREMSVLGGQLAYNK